MVRDLLAKYGACMNAGRRLVFADVGILVLRVSFAGFLLCAHGWDKLIHYSEKAASFPDPLHVGNAVSLALAVFAEAFCAAGVVVGAATRLALIPLIINMGVASFIVHAGMPFGKRELALVYFIVFVALFFTGPGRFSIDGLLFSKLSQKKS